VQAFKELNCQYEFEDITLIEIAREAGVSRQTLRSNFDGKSDIALAYLVRPTCGYDTVDIFKQGEKRSSYERNVDLLTVVLKQYGHQHKFRKALLSGQAGEEALERYLNPSRKIFEENMRREGRNYPEESI
jgi:AcrR family transcriptional regulator